MPSISVILKYTHYPIYIHTCYTNTVLKVIYPIHIMDYISCYYAYIFISLIVDALVISHHMTLLPGYDDYHWIVSVVVKLEKHLG